MFKLGHVIGPPRPTEGSVFFHIYTVHRDTIKVLLTTDAPWSHTTELTTMTYFN
jgi:hypothetical protein